MFIFRTASSFFSLLSNPSSRTGIPGSRRTFVPLDYFSPQIYLSPLPWQLHYCLRSSSAPLFLVDFSGSVPTPRCPGTGARLTGVWFFFPPNTGSSVGRRFWRWLSLDSFSHHARQSLSLFILLPALRLFTISFPAIRTGMGWPPSEIASSSH